MATLNKYRIKSKRLKGSLILVYKDSYLYSFINEFEQHLNTQQWTNLMEKLTINEADVYELKSIGLEVSRVADKTNEKIALFCDYYMKYHNGLKYKVSPADSGKIKHVVITDKLLTVYFTSDNFLFKNKHSISNYTRYFNELNQEANKPKENKPKSKYPNQYNASFERTLSGNELSNYWKHLRDLGLKPKKVRGRVVDWL